MALAPHITGLAVALFLVPSLAGAGPSLSGSYRAEGLGTVELRTEGGHVVGKATDGGSGCKLDPNVPVLEGDFEGSVLVARVTLCVTGDMCPPTQSYGLLGFYNEANRSVVA